MVEVGQFTNGGSTLHPCMQSGPDMSRRDEVSQNLLMAQNSTIGIMQGMNGQIPRNVCLSHLTADFSISSDILDNYSRSPYMAADTDFLNSHGNGDIQQGDNKRLDTISEGLSYEGFGSDCFIHCYSWSTLSTRRRILIDGRMLEIIFMNAMNIEHEVVQAGGLMCLKWGQENATGADLRRADYIAKQRAMEDALMASEVHFAVSYM
ncbi:hypothetical protein L2E82_00001 [Cichorium intybus]|uniref:Uncharacterized protein n=1 Tax=Cichorium intybus TaxID=13427 RepID=A0ACB9GXC3_CICIN|nr:hypothetical protein L2E82_00001 [Cichorium intybus]